MGKTSLALNIARNAAVEHRACVALFSLEMGRDALVTAPGLQRVGRQRRRIRFGEHKTEEEESRVMEATGPSSRRPPSISTIPR